ncbi:AAA-domain-containing protein [Dichomitus squalens LYAD-421 SS1]|uniref:AAA-domain-containing protein n=1 Tax=Dichomitus squalens (strain LYAD-421) TaxID=732165 RepID=R7SYJ3_DICSQ|nr:AAA-domain-containing protein [Dichomitus squalens LYAD-421 SS1]EJF60052.1 AAA-domain-containing protein [Dichomitus squalens LYAD-421 SS1]
MAPTTRGASRQQPSSPLASGSEYHESNASMDVEENPQPEDEDEEEPVEYGVSSRGRRIAKKSYQESASEDDPLDSISPKGKSKEAPPANEGEESDGPQSRYALRRTRNRPQMNGFIVSDEEDGEAKVGRYPTRNRTRNGANGRPSGGGRLTRRSNGRSQTQASSSRPTRNRLSTRRTRSSTRNNEDDEDGYVDEPSSGSADGEGSIDEAPVTSPEPEADADADGEADVDGEGDAGPEQDGKPYSLRQRAKINYAIPPPLEEMLPPPKPRSGGYKSHGRHPNRPKPPGWSATGAELSKWMGGGGDDSDSDYATRTPRKPFGGISGAGGSGGIFAGGAGAAGGFLPGDLAAAAGTPSNLGKVGDSALADADPLGVNQNVTFDEVGGLDDHINSLKEMTLLPLLYPEVFQRFNLTPPRGVLFHGPPGTGKTLLARALAASCRSNGKGISFFMRKGADCLSKWVGEAERQLRLLFEEARNQQPSIIFFDEIDGLAPVRSSKQDQIHASIVSTLLALMDGMDGRGQVVVIGATNRPDAVDPALRRPGRFDREFYFPLPNLEAREKILSVMTKKWAGWDGEKGAENAKGLAKLTKGYGGADLRALCTEAALNAVQRRYPQIYKSNDRLLLKPETIEVELRDFMISVKKLIPSSARSVSSATSPLPTQLVPLLQEPLDKIKEVIGKVLPVSKKRTALEEAEWEDVGGSEGALERELMMQSMETLRIYRPRVVLHGPAGMGQSYVAAAALHHLEGYHIQSLDLGSLLSDSTRTPEAAIVQLFVEAKRHQPSVVYIPSLIGWCAAVTETARTTVRAMLDTLSPTDPVLLLAVVDGAFLQLPRDVRQWFGPIRENRVALVAPSTTQRDAFFEGLLKDVRRPPIDFPDGMKRKKRVLEELPIAPPLEPRQPSAAELALQQDNDQRIITLLKYRLGPILSELKRKFKRFTKRAAEEYNYDFSAPRPPPQVQVVAQSVEVHTEPNGVMEIVDGQAEQQVVEVAVVNQVQEQLVQEPPLFDMDLERMNVELYKGRYLTPDDFLDDIRKIVHNASVRINEDPERLFRAQAMLTAAEVSCQDFDPQFRLDCQRMAARERQRRDEFRKTKQQEKAAEQPVQNGEYAPGTRRSARHTGQEPEIAITDPVQLERKLKRQRSNGVEATPSEDEIGEHVAKKSRTDGEDAGPSGEPQSPTTGGRSLSVRFADEVAPGIQSASGNEGTTATSEPNADDTQEAPRRSGFDPALLNPLSPTDARAGIPTDPPDNPFTATPSTSAAVLPQTQVVPQPNGTSSNANGLPADASIILDGEGDHPMEGTQPAEALEAEPQLEVPMEVERSPTPLPDFHIDEDSFTELKTYLRDATGSLNIEQLEQLRATCLGLVWRHRQDWDRTILLRELKEEAQEFIQEVSLDDVDAATP